MKKIFSSPIFGLPLLYIGVILMVVHFAFHLNSNTVLCVAICLEIIGVASHFYKLKH